MQSMKDPLTRQSRDPGIDSSLSAQGKEDRKTPGAHQQEWRRPAIERSANRQNRDGLTQHRNQCQLVGSDHRQRGNDIQGPSRQRTKSDDSTVAWFESSDKSKGRRQCQ